MVRAKALYGNPKVSDQRIETMKNELNEAVKVFESVQEKGYKEVLVVNKRFKDGTFTTEGRGRNSSLLANHVNVQLLDGKILNITIEMWNDTLEARKAIENDGFIRRIIDASALDVKPTKGYEQECESIIKAITQALERAIKDGEKLEIDLTLLKNKISKAEPLLAKYPKSKDGSDVKANEKWVSERDYNDLFVAIKHAKEYLNDATTSDIRDREITKLETAIRNYQSSLKKGVLNEGTADYQDGVYTVSTSGNNPLKDNEFEVEIRDGK